MKKAVILLADGFEEVEFTVPADVLRRLGVNAVTAAVGDSKSVTGSHGIAVTADKMLTECAEEDFDAVILPGGLPGATNLRDCPEVIAMLKKAAAAGKICAAICASPLVLNKAGLLQGRKFTAYPSPELYSGYGAEPSSERAVTDGNIITGSGPGCSFEFARAVAEALGLQNEIRQLFAGMLVKS